jgi:hypothetical protein
MNREVDRWKIVRWSLQTAAGLAVAFYGYVFFCCIQTSLTLFGWKIDNPGTLSIPLLIALGVLAGSLQPWRWTDRRACGFLLGLFLFFFVVLFHPHVGSDASYYYANLRSLWLDGDLNFYEDAFRSMGAGYLGSLHEKGYTYNGFSVGPAFFWTPFFLLGHWICRIANGFSTRFACDGYDSPTLSLVCASSALYALAGMGVCNRFLRRWVSAGSAAWAVALGVFASPLLLYAFHEGAYSHALGFFLGSAVVAVWWKRYQATTKADGTPPVFPSAALGLVCGLAILVRWQSGLYLLFPLMDLAGQAVRILKYREDRLRAFAKLTEAYCAFALGLSIAVLPQLAVWKVQTGHWLHIPQGGGYLSSWGTPHIGKVLFSPLHGLFSWHPVLLIAVLCIPLLWTRHKGLMTRTLLVLLGQLYINSVVEDWWAGGSFGQRRFSASLPLLIIPLGLGIEWVIQGSLRLRRGAWIRIAVGILFGFFILANFVLLIQYMKGPIGAMGQLDYRPFLKSWVVQKDNAFFRLQAILVYLPLLNTLAYGVLFLDCKLLFSGLGLTILLGLAGWLALCPAVLRNVPGAGWVQRRWGTLGAVFLLIFSAVIGWAGWRTKPLWVVNLKSDVPYGNVRLLKVNRSAGYEGGYIDRRLAGGESLSIPLDNPVESSEVILISYLEESSHPAPGIPIARLNVRGEAGQTFSADVLSGIHTASADAEKEGTPIPVVARTWRPARQAPFNAHSWRAQWPLPRGMRVEEVDLTVLYPEASLQVDGIAFVPSESRRMEEAAEIVSRCLSIDFLSQCNAAYDHNIFVPFDNNTYSHFQFKGQCLYQDGVRLDLYPSYEESKRWNALTTCCSDGQAWRIPVEPPRTMESLHLAFAAGLIRTRDVVPLVEIVLVHDSGQSQIRPIFANREAFDYLHGYRPSGSVIEGGESGYMYDGKVSGLSIDVDQPNDPVTAIEVKDGNGKSPAGISILAMTAVLVDEPAQQAVPAEGAVEATREAFVALACDATTGGFAIGGDWGTLYELAPDGARESIELRTGSIADAVWGGAEQGILVLYEDGTVYSILQEIQDGVVPLRLSQRAVAIEMSPDGLGYYVLADDGEVFPIGAPAFPGWDRAVADRFVAFGHQGNVWYGLTCKGFILTGGKKPGFDIPQGALWNWDIGRDLLVTDKGLLLLDGFGGLHSLGRERTWSFAGYRTEDFYTALCFMPDGGIAILDREGTVHRVGKPSQ